MKTYLDCIPCFYKQALEASKIAKASAKKQKEILNQMSHALARFPLKYTPPEMGGILHRIVKRIIKKDDPYHSIKQRSNNLVLNIYPKLVKKVRHSHDSLLTAVELSIAGNVIDYGIKKSGDIDVEIKKIVAEENKAINHESKRLFNYFEFKKKLNKSHTILYIADNTGETVFDRILIEEINRLYADKHICYAVRGKPIINDALIEDAYKCGIDKIAEVISSGLDFPGTILKYCSKEFIKKYKHTDMIISKGQGNYEALSEEKEKIFFLFMAKCPVVAKDIGCKVGDIILLDNEKTKERFSYANI